MSPIRCAALLVLASFPVPSLLSIAVVHAQTAKDEEVKPDFSEITNARRAGVLVRQGKLVRVLLFPAELGGPDVRGNRVYVPPEAAAALGLATHTLRRFTAEGIVDKMDVRAEYRGDSIVPVRIIMDATHSKKPGGFHPAIHIW